MCSCSCFSPLKIQTEIKNHFDYSTTASLQQNRKKSILFQSVPKGLIKKLKHEYDVDKGNVNAVRSNEAKQDRITRLVRESLSGRGKSKSSLTHVFETVIIDECHFLRNGQLDCTQCRYPQRNT